MEPAGQAENPLPQHAFGGAHRDDGHLGEVFDVGAQRHTVLRNPGSEDDKYVFLNELKECIAHRSKGSVRQALNRASHEFHRPLDDSACDELVGHQL
jgi:hypothetical protein